MNPPAGQPPASRWITLLGRGLVISVLCVALYFVINFSAFLGDRFESPNNGQPLSLALLFIAGTLTGFHCAGMCGALVVGYTVRNAAEGRGKYLTHLQYGAGKTLSYTIIGALFGALGAVVTFTPFMRGAAGLAAGVFLVLFGLSTLKVLAPLNRFQLRTPGFVMRFIGGALRRNPPPFVIGLLNGLMIICGPLQAMYIMAAGTGSPVEGAKMLFVFGLGTLPLMMGFGFLASALSSQFAPKLVRASGAIVVVLGLIMLQRGYVMLNSGTDLHAAMGHTLPVEAPGARMVHTTLAGPGPVAERPEIQAGVPVQWMLMGDGLAACGGRIQVPGLNQTFDIQPGMATLEFTPAQPGPLRWHCAAGGIEGEFLVKAAVPAKPEIPMAAKIRELIEKSATALEALRRQLHP